MKNIIAQITPYYRKIRQQIHSNPELRYEETETAELVAAELRKLGLEPRMNIGKTGVIAILDSGKPGKTVALRADMDALPMQEESNLPYQSKNLGKMHACGHDGHTASLLATVATLVQLQDKFIGKIKFIFQPAEEGGAGAKAMIEDGVLINPTVDAIFAFHNHPGYKVGAITTKEGCIFYGNTEFILKIRGKSGHAAVPNLAINPITVGAELAQKIPTLALQLSDSLEPVIITITKFNSGVANNIIPETAELTGTIRANSTDKLQQVKAELKSFAQTMVKNYDATLEIDYKDLYPPTINTSAATEHVLNIANSIFDNSEVSIKSVPSRASEDFSFFLQKIPGCYFLIGNGESSPSCHNSKFDFNDAILPVAVEMFCAIAISYLNQASSI